MTTTMNHYKKSGRNGQAMLLAVLAVGGAIMGATAIAGILMLYQIRSTTDSESSARAIFAADSGIEWALFNYFCEVTSSANPASRCMGASREQDLPVFTNQATLDVTCYDATAVATTTCSNTSTAQLAVSKGGSRGTKRAFSLTITDATGTLP